MWPDEARELGVRAFFSFEETIQSHITKEDPTWLHDNHRLEDHRSCTYLNDFVPDLSDLVAI